jgi:glycosyltransferase A (GT-A) superfamily protein (DUF2064 family)
LTDGRRRAHRLALHLDHLTVEAGIIEQRAEQFLEIADGVGKLAQLRFEPWRRIVFQQPGDEQAERLRRLAAPALPPAACNAST